MLVKFGLYFISIFCFVICALGVYFRDRLNNNFYEYSIPAFLTGVLLWLLATTLVF